MGEGLIEYIIVGSILFILIHIIYDKVKLVITLIRERNARDHNPYINVRDNNRHPSSITPSVQGRMSQTRLPQTRSSQDNRQTITRSAGASRRSSRPPMPSRPANSRRPLDSYPRCPICRCSNRPGMAQMVFMDGSDRWRCYKGHQFSS